jgi:hypothetical protein
MDQGIQVIIGMLISYFFAFLGLAFAWMSYHRRKRAGKRTGGNG